MSTYTQDITHLIGKINTNLPDNDTQAITAARIRDAMGAVAYNYDLYVLKTDLDTAGYVTASQLEGLATEQELQEGMQTVHDDAYAYVVEKINEIPGVDLSAYVTKTELSEMGYITENDLPDMSTYATKTYVADYVAEHAPMPDLSAYVTKTELSAAGYLTAVPSEYVTDTELSNVLSTASYVTSNDLSNAGYITNSDLSQASYVTQQALSDMGYITTIPSEYITETELSEMGYITSSYAATYYLDYTTFGDYTSAMQDTLINANILITDPETGDWTTQTMASETYVADYVDTHAGPVDLSAYVTKDELNAAGYLTAVPSEYVTESQLQSTLTAYITETELSAAGYITSSYAETYYLDYTTFGDYTSAMQDTLINANILITDPETGDWTPQLMASETYVAEYVASYAPTPDLSTYVTKNELSEAGYLTAVPSEYVTESQLQSTLTAYITETELSGMGYITSSEIPAIPVIDENLIPNTTLTYTLGDNTHFYDATYTNRVNGPSEGIVFRLGDTGKLALYSAAFRPATNNAMSLGTTNQKWSTTYSYEYNFGFNTRLYSSSDYNIIVRIGNNRYQFDTASFVHFDNSTTSSLGTSSKQWGYTYSANFIENGTNISDKYATKTELTSKQDTLISGTNIKTINNESLLGSGNIDIQGGGSTTDYSHVLKFTAEQANSTIKMQRVGTVASLVDVVLKYSTDNGANWTNYTLDTTITLSAIGDTVMFKGTNDKLGLNTSHYHKFVMTGKIKASGDVTSLLNETGGDIPIPGGGCCKLFYECTSLTQAPELPSTTLNQSCYDSMFYKCTSLTTAPELPATTVINMCYQNMFGECTSLTKAPELPATILQYSCYSGMFYKCTSLTTAPELPATTLGTACYNGMFNGCTHLTKAPDLPATTLVSSCYNNMFQGCTSLTKAPDLPATTLVSSCYSGMFQGCTSLTKAPDLPATTLVSSCYNNMFLNCTHLNYVKAMFTTTPSNTYTQNWLSNVSATGTFVKSNSATWTTTGTNAVPTGWTVYKTVAIDTDDFPESYVEDNGKGLQVVNGAWQKVSGLLTSANLIYDSTTNTLTINV